MKCPHCTTTIHESWEADSNLGQEIPKDGGDPTAFIWHAQSLLCPECGRRVIRLGRIDPIGGHYEMMFLAWPRGANRPLPKEVDDARYVQDFAEAVGVMQTSAKASAAISRRMLQDLLREKAAVKHTNLDKEIQQVIDSNALPTAVADNLDAVRVVGNFAAHPIKSTNTGEIVEVEPGEAGWLLEVLESLFDFYFVLPARAAERKAALEAKLQDAGKPPLKQATS